MGTLDILSSTARAVFITELSYPGQNTQSSGNVYIYVIF